jgi:hypothetical protein
MLSGLWRLLLYRLLGARVMLGLAILDWLRRLLGGRREEGRRRSGVAGRRSSAADSRSAGAGRDSAAYQPSQGSSQIVHREPR